jgi:drug/metabolite transporter (DMT)-like permease
MTAKTKAEAALAATTLVWGGTFAILKIGLEDISPILMVAVRFVTASILLLLFFHRKIFPIPLHAVLKGGLLGVFLFLGFVTQNIGITITTASKSAFITGMMVIFVPMLQFVIERRSPKIGNLLGVAIVSAGLWFLTSPAGSAFNAGDALTLACALLFAIYIVYLDVVSKEMTTFQLLFVQLASMGVYSVIAVLLFESPRIDLAPRTLMVLLYLTIFATLMTTWVQTRFQKDTTPTRAVVIFSVEPVIASAVAYLLLGETLGALGFLGGGLIIAGVLISELSDLIPFLNRTPAGDEP